MATFAEKRGIAFVFQIDFNKGNFQWRWLLANIKSFFLSIVQNIVESSNL